MDRKEKGEILNKELLSLILDNKGAGADDNIQITGDVIHYSNITYMSKISSYELANKCKSTFIHYGKGYCISSFIDFDGTWFANISGAIFKQRFQGTSEPEVIFEAAQWIIDIENESHKIEIDAELEDQYGKAK